MVGIEEVEISRRGNEGRWKECTKVEVPYGDVQEIM